MNGLLRVTPALTRQVRHGRVREWWKEQWFVKKWREAPDNVRRTRTVIITSGISLVWIAHQAPFYACLPPKPEMPLANPDGSYSPEVVEAFTPHQHEEYTNPIPFFPNRYRVWVAEKRMEDGWGAKYYYCKKWWEEATRPEYDQFLPDKVDPTPKLTVSFDITILLESDWDLHDGYRFRLRPGAKEFILRLSNANCELVLYTTYDYILLQPMADKLNEKFFGLLYLGENCQVHSPSGVNYKLFKNSCRYVQGEYHKVLTQMNRDLTQLIHVDLSPSSVEPESRDNCLFLDHFDKLEGSEQLRAVTSVLLNIIEVEPDDVRHVIKAIPKF